MKPITLDNIDDEPLQGGSSAEPVVTSIPAPLEQPDDDAAPSDEVADTFELATDLKAAFAQLAESERMPEATLQQQKLKHQRLLRVRRNVCVLQQGLPAVVLTADDIAVVQKKHAKIIREQRLEYLAREHPEVRTLLDSHRKLEAELKKAKKK